MARVIFCVLLTLEMRFRKDFRSGTGVSSKPNLPDLPSSCELCSAPCLTLRRDEALAERLQDRIEIGLDVVGDGLLFPDLFPEVWMLFVYVAIDFPLELPEGVHRELVQEALRTGIDEEHLLLDRPR